MLKPDYDELLKYWKVIRPIKKDEYVEIRFTDGNKPQKYYSMMRAFLTLNPDIISQNLVQLYLQNFSQLTRLLSYSEHYFFHNYKICYGLNLRKKNPVRLLGGSYEFLKSCRVIFFDIDKTDHSNLTEFERNKLLVYINGTLVPYFEKYGLFKPSLISSGGGYHCLYKIHQQSITNAKRRWFRTFVKTMSARLSNDYFEIDPIYDMTRVFALPETMNVKRQKKVIAIEASEHISNFKIKSERVKKIKHVVKYSKDVIPKLRNSLEWYILCHEDVPQGEVHRTLLFAAKLLLKELGVEDWKDLEAEMNSVRGTTHQLNPYYGTEGKEYSPFIIINWCKRHDDWCKKNNIVYEGYAANMMQKEN